MGPELVGRPIQADALTPVTDVSWNDVQQFMSRMTYGNIDLTREPLRMTEADTTDIQLTLTADASYSHKVSGRVTNLAANVEATVILVNGPISLSGPVASDGSFEISNVPSGNYNIRVSTTAIGGPGTHLTLTSLTGQRITVAADDLNNIAVQIP